MSNGRYPPARERLWSRIQKTPSGCWEYMGSRTVDGYGAIGDHGKVKKAHRIAYEQYKGPIPDGLVVMHVCDNPPCCNPEHLRVGTVRDNNLDREAKGRSRYPRERQVPDECHRGHKMTPENTYVPPKFPGQKACRECNRSNLRASRARARARRKAETEQAARHAIQRYRDYAAGDAVEEA